MATSRILRNWVMMLTEKEGLVENTQRQLRQKEQKCDELNYQCLALRYITLCQDCHHYLDSKRPGDTVEE